MAFRKHIADRTQMGVTALFLASTLAFGSAQAAPRKTFEIGAPQSSIPNLSAIVDAIRILDSTIMALLGLPRGLLPQDFLSRLEVIGTQDATLPRLEALLVRLGESRVQVAIEGATGLYFLGDGFYLNEAKGSLGIQVDLVDPKNPDLNIALRISPAFIELIWLNNRRKNPPPSSSDPVVPDTGSGMDSGPRSQPLIGGSLTFIIKKALPGGLALEAAAALRPAKFLNGEWNEWGLETAESLSLRIPVSNLARAFGQPNWGFEDPAHGRRLELELRVSHLQRNPLQAEIIPFHPTSFDSPNRSRWIEQNSWEALVLLGWRHWR